jgi:hypothetical protein
MTDPTEPNEPETSDSGDHLDEHETPDPHPAALTSAMLVNASIDGRLTIHFRTRDVTLGLDGHTAMRVMSSWQNPPDFPRPLSVADDLAIFRWTGIDTTEVVGVSWVPNLGDPTRVPPSPNRPSKAARS